MTVINDTTTARDYPKPHADNALVDDVPRVREALDMIDADVSALVTSVAGKVDVDSPALTGVPTAPTAVPGTSSGQLATTAFVAAGLDLKANLASPALIGVPTAPTAALGTNTTQLANTAFVAAALAALLDSAPGTLDTLNELAAALGDDPNFATTMATALAARLQKANNLSDLANIATAVNNLLGGDQGDILFRGPSTWSKLAKGAAGRFLKQNDALTAPEWGKGWEELPGGSINVGATAFVEVPVSSAYQMLRVSGDWLPAVDNDNLILRVGINNIINTTTGAYWWQYNRAADTILTGARNTNANCFLVTPTVGYENNEGGTFEFLITNSNVGKYKFFLGEYVGCAADGTMNIWTSGGMFLSTQVLTHLRFSGFLGSILNARMSIEGWRT